MKQNVEIFTELYQQRVDCSISIDSCKHGEEETIKELRKLPEIVQVYQVYGAYDLIAQVSVDTIDKLRVSIS